MSSAFWSLAQQTMKHDAMREERGPFAAVRAGRLMGHGHGTRRSRRAGAFTAGLFVSPKISARTDLCQRITGQDTQIGP